MAKKRSHQKSKCGRIAEIKYRFEDERHQRVYKDCEMELFNH